MWLVFVKLDRLLLTAMLHLFVPEEQRPALPPQILAPVIMGLVLLSLAHIQEEETAREYQRGASPAQKTRAQQELLARMVHVKLHAHQAVLANAVVRTTVGELVPTPVCCPRPAEEVELQTYVVQRLKFLTVTRHPATVEYAQHL